MYGNAYIDPPNHCRHIYGMHGASGYLESTVVSSDIRRIVTRGWRPTTTDPCLHLPDDPGLLKSHHIDRNALIALTHSRCPSDLV